MNAYCVDAASEGLTAGSNARRDLLETMGEGRDQMMDRGERTLAVIGSLVVDPNDRDQWLQCATELVASTRREPGAIDYAIGPDITDPGRIIFYERYRGPDGLKAHMASEHFRKFAQQVKGIRIKEGPSSVKFFEGEPYDSGPNILKTQGS